MIDKVFEEEVDIHFVEDFGRGSETSLMEYCVQNGKSTGCMGVMSM